MGGATHRFGVDIELSDNTLFVTDERRLAEPELSEKDLNLGTECSVCTVDNFLEFGSSIGTAFMCFWTA